MFVKSPLIKHASQQLMAIEGPRAIVPFMPDQIIENILNDGKTASLPFLR